MLLCWRKLSNLERIWQSRSNNKDLVNYPSNWDTPKRVSLLFWKGETMALSISEKGRRIVQLIKAVRAAGEIVPGAKVLMPEERPAASIGTVMDGAIQMQEFHLFDGTEVVLEVPVLNPKPGQGALLVTCELTEPAFH
jgi:hypothetical protein